VTSLERLLNTGRDAMRFPSQLVHFNLADSKRRNGHLGWKVVDADIATFAEIGRNLSQLDESACWARATGDAWLFLGADGSTFATAVFSAYAETRPYRAGWSCRAIKGDERKLISEVVTTTVTRSARCVGAVVPQRSDLESIGQCRACHASVAFRDAGHFVGA
jgi:hypothetical protein